MFSASMVNQNNKPVPTKMDVLVDNGNGEHNINVTIEFTHVSAERIDIRAKDSKGQRVGWLSATYTPEDNHFIYSLESFRALDHSYAVPYRGLGTILVYLCYQIATNIYGAVSLKCYAYNDAIGFYTKLGMTIDAEYYDSDEHRSSKDDVVKHYKLVRENDSFGVGYEAVQLKLYTDDVSVLIERGKKFVDDVAVSELLNSIQSANQIKPVL
jgi:hypothetical protein